VTSVDSSGTQEEITSLDVKGIAWSEGADAGTPSGQGPVAECLARGRSAFMIHFGPYASAQ
jgi:hypothetical protein